MSTRILTQKEIDTNNWIYVGYYLNPWVEVASKPSISVDKEKRKKDAKKINQMMNLGYLPGPVQKFNPKSAPHIIGMYRPVDRCDRKKQKFKRVVKHMVKTTFKIEGAYHI